MAGNVNGGINHLFNAWMGTLRSLPGSVLQGAACPLDRPPQLDDGGRSLGRWFTVSTQDRRPRHVVPNFGRITRFRFGDRVPAEENASGILDGFNAMEAGSRDLVPDTTGGFAPEAALSIVESEPGQIVVASPVTKEELGRASWTLLHTLAAQYPDKPTRQQQRDVKELMNILSRLYPCKQCADHFKEVLRSCPVEAGSGNELAQWMCRVHNIVNRSLGKPHFPCERVEARWGALHCESSACDLEGRGGR